MCIESSVPMAHTFRYINSIHYRRGIGSRASSRLLQTNPNFRDQFGQANQTEAN